MKMLSDDGYVKEVEFMDFVKFLLTVMLIFGTRDFFVDTCTRIFSTKNDR